jgi:hypothetical protein
MLHGYISSVFGAIAVSVLLRAIAVLAGDDVRRKRGARFSSYLALHSSFLVLVGFCSCLLAARVHDLPPTTGDAIFKTVQWDDDGDGDGDGDGDLAAVGALAGSVLALSRWRGWLSPLSGRQDLRFPWWLVIVAGFAGAVHALSMKAGQEGYMQGAARATRAVPYLFYLPAPRGTGYNYGRT